MRTITEGSPGEQTTPAMPALQVYRAIAAITAKLGEIGISKGRTSGDAGSPRFKYRGIDDVYAALNPLLAQHDLCILPRILTHRTMERITSRGNKILNTVVEAEFDLVSSIDGSTHTIRTIGEAMDSGDKSTNKAMSVAYKYAAFMAFAIPTEGDSDDPDAESHELGGDQQQPKESTKQPAKQEPTREEKEAIARAEFERAKSLMLSAPSLEKLRDVWEKHIDWDLIPKSWSKHIEAVRDEARKAIEDKLSKTAGIPFDDDIPF